MHAVSCTLNVQKISGDQVNRLVTDHQLFIHSIYIDLLDARLSPPLVFQHDCIRSRRKFYVWPWNRTMHMHAYLHNVVQFPVLAWYWGYKWSLSAT